MKTAVRQFILICRRNAQFDFPSAAIPCDEHGFESLLPVTQFGINQSVADFARSAGSYAPEFEQRGERFRRGMLLFAGRIQVRSLDADASGQLINGLLE
jgi:hypothetical protein